MVSFSAGKLQNAVANGDTRTLAFHHMHTGESLNLTFKNNGRYDEASLKKLNWFLRDWRRDEPITIDPHLFDLLWEIHREAKAQGPVTIVSAYRSPQTNAMLRVRGRGVARYSQHMVGKAIDFYIPGVELSDLRAIGLRLQRGGIGFYPTSGSPFVHLDTGGVRHWPRMTREQLARVFPDGKTVHIPSDGKPMAGFALALAEIEARGGKPGTVALAARGEGTTGDSDRPVAEESRLKRIFASIFGRKEEEGDEEEAGVRSNRTRLPTATALTSAPAVSASKAVATTAVKPVVVASLAPALSSQTPQPASSTPLPRPRPSVIGETAELPPLITGSIPRTESSTLAYAAENSYGPHFGPLPSAHTRLSRPPIPLSPQPSLPAQSLYADKSAPATLFSASTFALSKELHHPDLVGLRGMIVPVRAALRVRFGEELIEAPATVRFSGPAVVALQTVAFDRGSGSVTGAAVSRMN